MIRVTAQSRIHSFPWFSRYLTTRACGEPGSASHYMPRCLGVPQRRGFFVFGEQYGVLEYPKRGVIMEPNEWLVVFGSFLLGCIVFGVSSTAQHTKNI
jgi:hypothetical protein